MCRPPLTYQSEVAIGKPDERVNSVQQSPPRIVGFACRHR